MRKLLRKCLSNKFLVSFSTLASGSIIAQLITILISPVITRLFTPEEFGFYTVILTAISLFGPIICLKYDMAIVIAKTERDSYALIKLCLYLVILLSIIISILYGIIVFQGEYSAKEMWNIIIVISILLMAYGANNILLAYNNRHGLYRLIASVTVFRTTTNNILLVSCGLLNFGLSGLILSQIISSLTGLWRQSIEIRKNILKIKDIRIIKIKEIFFENLKFPIFNASSALITTSVYSSINLFIALSFSVQQLGFYSLSYRILGIPFTIISANIARVFFESATKELEAEGSYSKTYNKTKKILFITIIPVIILLAMVAPWIFPFLFGEEWAIAGIYVTLLSPMFAVRLIAESLTTSFIVSGKQHVELLFQSLLLLGQLLIYLFTLIFDIPIEQFLILISILYLVIYGIMISVMSKLSKKFKS